MKQWRTATALMVASLVAGSGLAQSVEELQKQLNEMKAAMQSQARALDAQGKAIERLETENASLKSQAGSESSALETEINRLSERQASATNLRSCASAIKLGGEFRFRGYYQDFNAVVLGEEDERDGWWVDQRVRLNFQYDFGCDVTAFAELQSRFAWGEHMSGSFFAWSNLSRPDEVPGAVGMYQGWLEFRNVLCHPELSTRIGRQEIVLGNQFQFGNADWYNGVSFDALRIDWRANCWSLTGIASKLTTVDSDVNQLPSYFTDHDDDELYSLYFTLGSIRNMAIDAYWIYINGHGGFAQNSGASFFNTPFLYPLAQAYFHTFGARIGGTIGVGCGLDYNLEGAIQMGETHITGSELDTDGFAVEAELGLTLTKEGRFRIFARGLYAEGAEGDSAGYLILFPNRHSNTGFRARYGLADMIPMTNVMSLQAGLHFDPACDWTVGVTGLYAMAEEELAGVDDVYGTELDLWAEYRYSKLITLGAGVAVVLPDESGEALWGVTDDTQFIGYLQARLIF
jgi:Alginate export